MQTQAGAPSHDANSEDIDLLKAVSRQDQNALQIFYKLHAATVYAFVARRISAVHVAEEVTNDTFVQVWRSAGKFQERASVRTWLLGIAKHIVMDALRAQYRSSNNEQSVPDLEHYETADPTPGPYELTLASQKGAQLVACFDALSPDHRECLHLAFVEGLTLGEIASVVNAPSNTVGTRIHHAKHKLKACLETRLGVGEVV